jgi:hypothetical protein
MAKKTAPRTPAPTFHEVEFSGSPKSVRGLLAGLIIGSGIACERWYHADEDIAPGAAKASMRRAAEKLHLMPVSTVQAVVTGELAKLLRGSARAIAARGVAEVVRIKRIKKARVELRYHTFARRYDNEVQTLLKDLPRGVKLEQVERSVEVDEDARGVEMYTAVHDFESCGSCVLAGRFDLVLDLRNRLDVHPLIECGEIELELA